MTAEGRNGPMGTRDPQSDRAPGEPGGYSYVGSELELFAGARRWKAYLRRQIAPFLGREVLEVGAGIGGTTRALCGPGPARWVCLEPDRAMADRLRADRASGALPGPCEVVAGTTGDLLDAGAGPFDSALYIDVIEHIEDDRSELARAALLLRPGGHLVVLSPAHGWLFSPFDEAVGHFRRYSLRTLRAAAPEGLVPARLRYLDAAGLLASAGNRFLLRSGAPTAGQVRFWDSVLVRLSERLDPCLGYRAGKSVLGVWRRGG